MIAFVFSGQGAQKPGMGKDLYDNYQKAREIFFIAEKVRPGIKQLCFEGSKEDLNITINTQPCVFTVDCAAALTLYQMGIKPDMVAGFSLGEIAALAFSGILSYEDAFKLVIKRAEFMHEETLNNKKGKGTMAAILGAKTEDIVSLTKKYETVEAVNFNCPGQIVVSGSDIEIELFAQEIKQQGAKVKMLAVSGAFHCSFMDGAADKMADYLKNVTVEKPKIPIYSNYTSKIYEEDKVAIKENITKQINNAVKWEESVRNMIDNGAKTFIEVGEGKVLCGLISKIDQSVKVIHYSDILNSENMEGNILC